MTVVKPGVKTSEFAVLVATVAAALLGQVFKRDLSTWVPQIAAALPVIYAPFYALARGLAKRPAAVAPAPVAVVQSVPTAVPLVADPGLVGLGDPIHLP